MMSKEAQTEAQGGGGGRGTVTAAILKVGRWELEKTHSTSS